MTHLVYDVIKPPHLEPSLRRCLRGAHQGLPGLRASPLRGRAPLRPGFAGSAIEAAKRGFITAVLVGPEDRIRKVAEEAKIDLGPYRIVSTEHSHASAAKPSNWRAP